MQKDFLEFAIEVAAKAGDVLLKYHRLSLHAQWTTTHHFKTQADDENDRLAREAIREEFPGHGIHSEEGAPVNLGSWFRWYVDGVDGTIGFLSGYTDHFAFSMGLGDRGRPIVGVVNAVGRGELYTAKQGGGAFCNGNQIHVSDLEDLHRVLMGVDSGKHHRTAHLRYMERLLQPDGIACPMCTGCASVPLCLVASGVLHAYLATSLEPEDMAAAVILIREAGGLVTNLNGKEWQLGDGSILAANPVLHGKLLKLLGLGRVS